MGLRNLFAEHGTAHGDDDDQYRGNRKQGVKRQCGAAARRVVRDPRRYALAYHLRGIEAANRNLHGSLYRTVALAAQDRRRRADARTSRNCPPYPVHFSATNDPPRPALERTVGRLQPNVNAFRRVLPYSEAGVELGAAAGAVP